VASRLANGDPAVQQGNMPGSLELARTSAETLCSYGPSFDRTDDASLGFGPNTAGLHGETPGGVRAEMSARR
jgi:hypothetical protein